MNILLWETTYSGIFEQHKLVLIYQKKKKKGYHIRLMEKGRYGKSCGKEVNMIKIHCTQFSKKLIKC